MNYLDALMKDSDTGDTSIFKKCVQEFNNPLVPDTESDDLKKNSKSFNSDKKEIKYVKSKSNFKPSKDYLKAKEDLLNLCKTSDEFNEEFYNELKYVKRPDGKVLKLCFPDDKIGDTTFSKKKFFESKYFVYDLQDLYSEKFNCDIKVKMLNSSEDNEYKISIKPLVY